MGTAPGFWPFVGVAAVVVAVPGPSVLFTVSRALSTGRRAAVFTVLGNSLGVGTQLVAVALGFGLVLVRSTVVVSAIKWFGAAYLVVLGLQTFRHRRLAARSLSSSPAVDRGNFRDGFVVGMTNPKSAAFLTVVLPEFVSRNPAGLTVRMLLTGLCFPLIALLLDSVWALAAGTARQWLSRDPERLAKIGGAGGLAIIGLGLSLALTGRRD